MLDDFHRNIEHLYLLSFFTVVDDNILYTKKSDHVPGQKRRSETADMREFARGSPSSLSPSPVVGALSVFLNDFLLPILLIQLLRMPFFEICRNSAATFTHPVCGTRRKTSNRGPAHIKL